MANPEVQAKVCEIARTARYHGPESPKLDELRRDLRAAKLADSIRRAVEAAPPLTEDQRDQLAALLRGGGVSAA